MDGLGYRTLCSGFEARDVLALGSLLRTWAWDSELGWSGAQGLECEVWAL